MSTTLTVDDELLTEAQRLTGLTEKSDVVREAQSFAFYPLETGFGSFFAPTIDAGGSAEMTAWLANSGSVAQEPLT